MGSLARTASCLLDLMMPRTCLVCGRRLGAMERHLCIWCASDAPLTYYWERPHNPMADAINAILERSREEGQDLPYAYATAYFFYHGENPYKRIPQALKYRCDIPAGRFFASRLGAAMALRPHLADVDLVVPVPLHPLRKWSRGYNQAEVIAGAIAKALGARMDAKALKRVRRTGSQTRLDAESRLRNVMGVFRLRHPVQGKHILLVDDTFTTGATLAACHEALRSAIGHSARISVATLSVVQD